MYMDNLPKLNQKESENLNRQIITNETEAVTTNSQQTKSNAFTGEFFKQQRTNNYPSHTISNKFKTRIDSQTLFLRPAFS